MKQMLTGNNMGSMRCFNHSDLDIKELNQNSFVYSPASESCTFSE